MPNLLYNDISLWQAFLQKDPLAEQAVFYGLYSSLCLYTEKITQHQAQAEDIVSESMIAAFAVREQFAQKENLQRYLFRVVHNAAINYTTQLKTRTSIHERIQYLQQQDIPDNDPIESEALRAKVLQVIYQEIEELPDQCRRIFKMVYIEDRTHEEVADALNIHVQTVRSQKFRALKLLRTRLLKEGKAEVFVALLSWLSIHS